MSLVAAIFFLVAQTGVAILAGTSYHRASYNASNRATNEAWGVPLKGASLGLAVGAVIRKVSTNAAEAYTWLAASAYIGGPIALLGFGATVLDDSSSLARYIITIISVLIAVAALGLIVYSKRLELEPEPTS